MSVGNNEKANKEHCSQTLKSSDRNPSLMDDDSQTSSIISLCYGQSELDEKQTAGRWTHEEHTLFLEGLKIFGREWKKVAERIPTRTSAQIRSHAQKYFAKLARDEGHGLQEQPSTVVIVPSPPQVIPSSSSKSALPSSVQKNVERILSNPQTVEKEVEETLRALRERYIQLQIRLEETTRCQSKESLKSRANKHISTQNDKASSCHKKSTPLNAEIQFQYPDDFSSISSAGFSPTRELGDQELIALSVLGSSLTRSSSAPQLLLSADYEKCEEMRDWNQNSTTSSSFCSSINPRENSETDSNLPAKRLRLSDDESENTKECDQDFNHEDAAL
jgi:SHAQKYF class myb-like DNA-binding protein